LPAARIAATKAAWQALSGAGGAGAGAAEAAAAGGRGGGGGGGGGWRWAGGGRAGGRPMRGAYRGGVEASRRCSGSPASSSSNAQQARISNRGPI
jgi:hypothetical protein